MFYEGIGRELVGRIESRDAMKLGTNEALEAQVAIDDYLREISALRRQGRPKGGTSDETLRALHEETTDLLVIIWSAIHSTPSEEARDLLSDHGITDPAEQDRWATRLALPMLSMCELAAIHRYVSGAKWFTPRRLSIFFLARRFELRALHVARRLVGSDEEEEFKSHGSHYPI